MNIDKNHLLNKSKEFCMFPWMHLHVTPHGTSAPCCIAKACSTPDGMGNARSSTLLELVNSPQMNELRLDMLNGRPNDNCTICYDHDRQGITSWRKSSIQSYPDVDLSKTLVDGSLSDFKMRYYDIRFSNICNFKCRTCTQEFSSQWEQENKIHGKENYKPIPKNNNKKLLQDVFEHIPYMEEAYFAGGEPLITEEHYLVLEEMIRQKRTDIQLRYNTNFSNLKFKNRDLIGLWKHFDKHVMVFASIDHVGERAEYIRAGTDWGKIEENYLLASAIPNIAMTVNTVLSVFNYLTFDKFYQHLIDKQMYTRDSSINSIYFMNSPPYLTCHILPTEELRNQGKESIYRTAEYMKQNGFDNHHLATIALPTDWTNTHTVWKDMYDDKSGRPQIFTIGEKFKQEIARLDKVRGDDFVKVFPELAILLDL